METIGDLKNQLPQTGRLEWIGLAPKRRADLAEVQEATLHTGTGIEGEHHATSGESKRQVTLIQHEHLPVIAGVLHKEKITPDRL
ncbi:MAG: MOSC domain-containing protein, partial [Planctomycetaceae bacterium]|nr:MOSC domain-containing protein [Planctomycetaceae bacterium]